MGQGLRQRAREVGGIPGRRCRPFQLSAADIGRTAAGSVLVALAGSALVVLVGRAAVVAAGSVASDRRMRTFPRLRLRFAGLMSGLAGNEHAGAAGNMDAAPAGSKHAAPADSSQRTTLQKWHATNARVDKNSNHKKEPQIDEHRFWRRFTYPAFAGAGNLQDAGEVVLAEMPLR